MKANRRASQRLRAFAREREGVAAILGGVLIASVLVMAFVTFRVSYVPAMESRREVTHMREVEQQFLALKSGVDRQVENQSLVPLSHPVTLGADSSSMWGNAGGSDLLRYEAAQSSVELSANRLLLLEKNGTGLAGTAESWTTTGGTSSTENITGVASFRIKITNLDKQDNGKQILLEVKDSAGAFVGDVRVMVNDPGGSEYHLEIRTRDKNLNEAYNMPYDSFPNGDTVATYWLDMLDPEFRFNSLLAGASAPFKVVWTIKTLTPSEYAMTYTKYDSTSGGEVVVGGGGGILLTNYLATKTSGRLVFETTNRQLVDQTWILENGALVIDQSEGRIFKVEPSFSAQLVGNKTLLTVVVPSLTGGSATLMGQGTVTVTTTRTLREMYVADAPRYEVKVTTDFPTMWKKFWDAELEAAGLVEGAAGVGEFNLTTGSDWAKVSVYGKVTPVAHTYYDLQVTLRQANIKVELES